MLCTTFLALCVLRGHWSCSSLKVVISPCTAHFNTLRSTYKDTRRAECRHAVGLATYSDECTNCQSATCYCSPGNWSEVYLCLLGEGFPPLQAGRWVISFRALTTAHTVVDMSGLHPTDNRYCDDENNASDSESSDDEVEEGLLVERNREMFLGKSTFYMCLSTLDEWVQ